METQIDIFGNEIPMDYVQKQRETIKSRWRRMYGYDHANVCGTCRFTCDFEVNGKKNLKCNLMGISDSPETDIAANDPACKRWEKRDEYRFHKNND